MCHTFRGITIHIAWGQEVCVCVCVRGGGGGMQVQGNGMMYLGQEQE